MTPRDRKNMAVTIAVAGMLGFGAVIASAATAAADPPPGPVEPAPPAEGQPGAPPAITPLIEGDVPQSPNPSPGYDFLLGQSPLPTAPGSQPVQPIWFLDQAVTQSMMPTNFALAGQGQQSYYSYTPITPDAPPAGLLDNLRGAHGLWHYEMGRLDQSQLGEPLPGTAPPPGTNIPVGLGENLPDPVAPPPVLNPAAMLLPPAG